MKNLEFKAAWQKLQILGEKQGSIRLDDLAKEMGLGSEETLSFLRQIFPEGSGLEIYTKESESWVDIDGNSIQYMLPLTPAEWIQLHQMLQSQIVVESPVTYSLRKKITENGPTKVVMELLNQLELWDQELNERQQTLVRDLEAAIAENALVTVATAERKSFHLIPIRVLHLEGQLSLIAEDEADHCLLVLPLRDVSGVERREEYVKPKLTAFEIEEFIAAVRALNEKETRLILKIHDPQSINLFPDHHFLGKPCMITNPEGDLIWAAYVEPCESLFDWLMTLGRKVEILDPIKFKEEYLMYCEEKLRKIA